MLGVVRDGEGGLGGSLRHQGLDAPLLLVGGVRGRRPPLRGGRPLTPRAVAITAAAVGDDGVTAFRVVAARNKAAERRRAAALDRAHDLQLLETDMAAVGVTPSGTVVGEGLSDLH